VSEPAVVFGGPSPEHDISVITGLQAVLALSRAGVAAHALYWSKTGEWFEVDRALEASAFLEGVPRGAAPVRLVATPGGGFVASGRMGREKALELSSVVNCCHGGPGEDGTLQGVLDVAGVAYTGPTVAGAGLGMDKLAFGAVVATAGLPTLPRTSITYGAGGPGFAGPFIVKPRFGGSSIGIEITDDYATAQALSRSSVHLKQGALVEQYRPNAIDVQVAIRSFPSLQLSVIEKPLRGAGGSDFLTYGEKYVGGEGMVNAPRELPAVLPDGVEDKVRDAARRVAVAVGVRGVARLDFLLDGGDLFVNEINTIPGSLSKYLWEASTPSVPFADLLSSMLQEAKERPSHLYTATGADGSALRSAGKIASKLG
jgi:D-alanine-D-alanine ligase